MPSRKRNIRLAKSTPDATPATDVAATPDATPDVAATSTPDAATDVAATPATDDTPATPDVSEFTTPATDVIGLPDAITLTPHPVPTPDATPATDATPDATPDVNPVAEPSNRSKLQAEFDEKRCAAITSSLGLYDGPSLAVHRSDKQPADAPYLSRVAKPVQIAKNIKPRDDANLLACFDHLTTYYGGDYTAGFNPARFGADLGAISRNASLNRLGLTPDGQHVVLTPLGLANARNLAASRAKLAAKAKSGE